MYHIAILATLMLSACVSTTTARVDCTEGVVWRSTCEREAKPQEPATEQPDHWATRDNEPDSRTDPEAHRDWQRDRDQQREEGVW
jgi:hypothetical protein